MATQRGNNIALEPTYEPPFNPPPMNRPWTPYEPPLKHPWTRMVFATALPGINSPSTIAEGGWELVPRAWWLKVENVNLRATSYISIHSHNMLFWVSSSGRVIKWAYILHSWKVHTQYPKPKKSI
jgi:hypothetical protein